MRPQRSSSSNARSALLRVLVGAWAFAALVLLPQCHAGRADDATRMRRVWDTSSTELNTRDQGSLRVEASPVVPLQLRSQDSQSDSDDSDNAYGWNGDIYDDDSDGDSDDDVLEPQAACWYQFTLGRQWHVYSATEQGVFRWAFQIAVSLPGQTFVHILKDDPDYKDERKRYKHGDTLAPIAKIVAESNNSVLLNDLRVLETAQGWSVASVREVAGTPTARRIDDLVVRVYLNQKEYKSQQLQSLVSTGAGDVVVHKKVLPRSALSLQIASRGNGSMFLQSSSSLSYTSLVVEATGNSSVYARFSRSLSVGASMLLTVDGTSSIGIHADRISASLATAAVTDAADICVSASRVNVGGTLSATVVGDGSISMFADRGQTSRETILIDGSGEVDTSSVSSISTDVVIHGGPASANVRSVFKLSYDVPPGSHVRYRGRSPMMYSRTPGLPLLEALDSSSKNEKCRAVVIPDEPRAGRFLLGRSPDSQSPDDTPVNITSSPKTSAASPASTFTTGQASTTPEVDKAIDKANDKAARGEAKAEAATSKAADIVKALPFGVGFGGPWQDPYPPASTSAPTKAPTFTLMPTTTEAPITPTPVLPTTAIPAAMQEPTATLTPAPTPTNASTPGMAATASTTVGESKWKIEGIYFQLAAGFIAFIWLLHQLLYCCDRCSRRRNYEAIQGGDEDAPVVV